MTLPTFAICLIFLVVPSLADLPKLRNIEFTGHGYNIFKGNPRSTQGGQFDPGFTSSVFDTYDYSAHRVSADNRYLVPNGVEVLTGSQCASSFTSDSFTGASSYSRALSVDASFSVRTCVWRQLLCIR